MNRVQTNLLATLGNPGIRIPITRGTVSRDEIANVQAQAWRANPWGVGGKLLGSLGPVPRRGFPFLREDSPLSEAAFDSLSARRRQLWGRYQ